MTATTTRKPRAKKVLDTKPEVIEMDLTEQPEAQAVTTPRPKPKTAWRDATNQDMTAEELIQVIRERAEEARTWGGGGWDVIADQWTDAQIAEAIKGAKTPKGAIVKVGRFVVEIREAKKAKAQVETTEAA
jgi:hypothetical protein